MPFVKNSIIEKRTPSPVRLDRMYRRSTRINTVISNIGSSPFEESFSHKMKNVSGGTLNEGDIVVSGFTIDPSYPDGYPPTSSLPESASIVSRYLFDEASGNALDSVGTNHLTDNNTVGVGAGLSLSVATFARSRDFEASNSEYFNIADVTEHDLTGSFTLSVLINPESQTGSHRLFTKMDQGSGTNRNYVLQMVSTDAMSFSVWDTSNTEFTVTTANSQVGTGAIQLWEAVYEAGVRLTLYKNGVKVAENTTSIPSSLKNSTSGLVIGATSDGLLALYDGLMQDGIIWKGAPLTDEESTALYDAYATQVELPPAQTIRADQVTTTTSAGDVNVFGMIAETILDQKYGNVIVKGYTKMLKVNGTTDIAIGDYITTHTVAKIGKKAATGDTIIAKALEAYTGNDSNGVIEAMIIPPRLI